MNTSANFLAEFNLSNLDGQNGFAIKGINLYDGFGTSVSSAGDINGDGIDDVIVGAPGVGDRRGESYVVFGSTSGLAAQINVSDLDGSNGFVLSSTLDGDGTGESVSGAGDVNGDGIDDIIIGAPENDAAASFAGAGYIVFGRTSGFSRELALSTIDGNNGFVLIGTGDRNLIGSSVSSAGDVNGDGMDDVIVGGRYSYELGDRAGESYVVYGRSSGADREIDLANIDGSEGFRIKGKGSDRASLYAVSGAGDINGDGFDDIIVATAPVAYDFSEPDASSYSVAAYVVLGKPSGSEVVELSALEGTDGFELNVGTSNSAFDDLSVSGIGDINNDGFDDVAVGFTDVDFTFPAPNGTPITFQKVLGETYIVFGKASGFDAQLTPDELDGSNGFTIQGRERNDSFGQAVSGAGDINGDGIDDLIVGANLADSTGPDRGESYVVFGNSSGFGREFDLSSLDGSNGFVLNGVADYDLAGSAVSRAGDINGDGIDDVIIGAPGSMRTGIGYSTGESYVVFGSNTPVDPNDNDDDEIPSVQGQPATAYVNDEGIIVGTAFLSGEPYNNDRLFSNTDGTDNPNDVMVGTSESDNIWSGVAGSDIIAGGAGNDLIGFGLGDAQVEAGRGNDLVYAISGSDGNNIIDLGRGRDGFYAVAGNNTISGSGDNLIGIGTGNDTVTTLGGDDFIYSVGGGGGTNVLNLGGGINTVWVEKGDYTITSNGGFFNTIGLGTGTDTVRVDGSSATVYMVDADGTSDGAKDIITGSGNDFIQAGSGDDLLDAGGGFNGVVGGAGADTFVFKEFGATFIVDFTIGIDRIKLDGFEYSDLSFVQGSMERESDISILVEGRGLGIVMGLEMEEIRDRSNFI